MPRPAAAGAKKTPSSHKLPEQFPEGMQLKDLCKQEWTLGKVIGSGGFGLIYLASAGRNGTHSTSRDYVIKIEPKENGPLYCEMQFYQRVLKKENIQSFITANKLKYLGIPPYIGAGSVSHNGKEYRFLVMDRFETDLQKLLVEDGGTFSPNVVFAIGLRMLDALHFCHSNEYVHADIKASNILLSKGKEGQQVYLVDFGLAYRYIVEGVHKKYKEDPRQAHNGTIEFTSRDAHKGVAPAPRGDFEILGYCMLQWLCKKLPWEDQLKNASSVATSKEKFMNDIPSHMKTLLHDSHLAAETLKKYFELVKSMNYDDTPNYKGFKKILLDGLSSAGQKNEWEIDFGTPKSRKRKSEGTEDQCLKKMKGPTKSPATPKKSVPPKSKNSPVLKPSARRSPGVKTKLVNSPLVNANSTKSPRLKCKPIDSPLLKSDSSESCSTTSDEATHHNHFIHAANKSPALDKKFPVSASSSKGIGKTLFTAKGSPRAALKRQTTASKTSPANRKLPISKNSSNGNGKSPLIGDRKKQTATLVRRKRVPRADLVNVSIQTSPFTSK